MVCIKTSDEWNHGRMFKRTDNPKATCRLQLSRRWGHKMTCTLSEYSNQPGKLPSMISIHCKPGVTTYKCTAKTLARLGRCSGLSESSLGAQVILLDLSCSGMFTSEIIPGMDQPSKLLIASCPSECDWNELPHIYGTSANAFKWATSRDNVSLETFDQVWLRPFCSATEAS